MAIWNRGQPAPQPIRIDPERSAQMDDYVAGQIGADDPGLALSIVKSGTVAHAAGYGLADWRGNARVTQDTIFHLASCGKQFTGLGILMLAEERKLHPDDPIGKHLPWLAGFGPKVTLRHLLHHTSGIRDLYDDDGIAEVLARCQRATNVDIVRTYEDLGCPMARRGIQPGDEFCYSNSGYDLLGAVIERLSGQAFHEFFRSRVFDRLGMKDTFSVPDRRVRDRRCAAGCVLDDGGDYIEHEGTALDDVVGSGTIYSTAMDLCLYDQGLAANALVTAASMREALTSGKTNDGNLTDYGFGWKVGTYEGMRFADHDGDWIGYFSYICRYLDQPLSIFVLSNNPETDLVEVANVATSVYR
ncbi:MAG: hypothetical protein QOI40_312 [Alphaproteobacteria bacterium]|jgi:CubicO group peptidase (beta-lactamase class C family)|nr:hypothetical protein [Alphaproteobacteria bacterium]